VSDSHGCRRRASTAACGPSRSVHHDVRSTARQRRQRLLLGCARRERRAWPRRSAPWQAGKALRMALIAHRPTVVADLQQHVLSVRATTQRVSARCRHVLARIWRRVQGRIIDLLKCSGSCKNTTRVTDDRCSQCSRTPCRILMPPTLTSSALDTRSTPQRRLGRAVDGSVGSQRKQEIPK
jgi:hypothetical protein